MAFLDAKRFPVATIFFQLSDQGRQVIMETYRTEGMEAAAAEMSALFVEEGIATIVAEKYSGQTLH